ncbi:hypothetical protein DFP72DRAFT_579937 [Ephemerocybe angulata]|uniref:Uncharacterized protein n=1 Tax=Ephemerocybe angulata TaxID=980116 RepID=A0A8H6HM70_9AGAR|nr:hypothetical protein DFP72DRAFT_579937 [Tulosesus angulatus]
MIRACKFLPSHRHQALEMDANVISVFPDTPIGRVHVLAATPEVLEFLYDPETFHAKKEKKLYEKDPTTWFYKKAWGNKWPQHTGTILRADVVAASDSEPIAVDAMELDQDDEAGPIADDSVEVPERFEYTCLDGITAIAHALYMPVHVKDVLIVRKEFMALRDVMEKAFKAELEKPEQHREGIKLVLAGHPGIGKTAFLLYLLLHRLECKLPTAIQSSSMCYIIFDEEGATRVAPADDDRRLAKCWALTDSNAYTTIPCAPFLLPRGPPMLIQAALPKPSLWKQWVQQSEACVIVSDLPTTMEIAATLKELGREPSVAFDIAKKWGPNIRTAIKLSGLSPDMQEYSEKVLIAEAMQTAMRVWANPSTFSVADQELPSTLGCDSDTLFFFRPRHDLTTNIWSRQIGAFFIPTTHLRNIFEGCGTAKKSNYEIFDLFQALSSHSWTRDFASWAYEGVVHRRLGSGGAALPIYRPGVEEKAMATTSSLLPGTVSALMNAPRLDIPFYWMPSVVDLPGVDGVLGDGKGNLYVVQAISRTEAHRSPVKGLQWTLQMVKNSLRDEGHWYFVVVGDDRSMVDDGVDRFSTELEGVTFGRHNVRVEVWGCVLPKQTSIISGLFSPDWWLQWF